MLNGTSGLATRHPLLLSGLQIGQAGPNRSGEPFEYGPVNQENDREGPTEPNLDPVRERQRPSLNRQAVRDVDLHYVAGARRPTHHAALPASADACRADLAPAGARIPLARKL
jgi:hypothetical protein